MNYFLMKSEPSEYGIDDLVQDGESSWYGIRNYQVRNMIRDQISPGDKALFYHSNCAHPGVFGTMEIVSDAYGDETQFDPQSPYFDHRSSPSSPRWLAFRVRFRSRLATGFLLADMRTDPRLSQMVILKRGNRLSITPITPEQFALLSGEAPL